MELRDLDGEHFSEAGCEPARTTGVIVVLGISQKTRETPQAIMTTITQEDCDILKGLTRRWARGGVKSS
jgi:hypothetical protein